MPGQRRRSRSKTRRHDGSSRRRNRSRPRSRTRTRSPVLERESNTLSSTLNMILSRLTALENNKSVSTDLLAAETVASGTSALVNAANSEGLTTSPNVNSNVPPNITPADTDILIKETPDACISDSLVGSTPLLQPRENSSTARASTQDLIDAISSLKPNRSQNYFISNFDPATNDIDDWCKEVERAKFLNSWDDYECLFRVANSLKGDARTWLHDWVSNDRSWRNFISEFKPLCPRRLDYANILYDAMSTHSDKYPTYAEYARRTLLRLRIVKGLSDELIVLIVIRGITDPQIRAAATNANLTPENLVSFLSIYVKPGNSKQALRTFGNRKRHIIPPVDKKCFICGQAGHKSFHCSKKSKPQSTAELGPTSSREPLNCTFCKKPGHTEQTCFAKNRSEPRNKRKVNLCTELNTGASKSSDITTAVIQGIPVDVLIDSGALNVSLISSNILKYFSCTPIPVNCTLRGIGGQDVVADSCVTLTIEFSEISLEVDLIVVPSKCMNTPIIIGTDILNRDGVTYIRTKDRQYLTRSAEAKQVGVVSNVSCNENLSVVTPLQGSERDRLMAVLKKYEAYLISGTATTTVKTGKMHINLIDQTPVSYRPYKLSLKEKLKVREIIRDLLDKGIIRESQSQYSSPILLVKKKDGTDRMCVDYRALNRLTVRDRYPLPLIDDHIDRLGNFKYFSSLDMATGFHQVPIDEESIHKTGFVTPEGHYEFVKMPFGLTNSPIIYQRIINETLRSYIEAGSVLVYIDDVLLMSHTVDEGIELLGKVLQTLTDAGFSINLRKCSFLVTEVEYLGRVISEGQVRPSFRKVEALVNAKPPQNVKQVRQFLGLAGYFRRYIENYAAKTTCISRLTKKDVPFIWGPEQERVRQDIITRLTSEPILAIFDPDLPTEIHTDASSIGYGAVLMQTHRDGKKRVVAYFSKSTQGAESRYHSYELETLAVVRALQHFRHYLIGLKFKIVTDCNALKATEKKKDLLPRVARWWVYLQDFVFDIEYRKGTMMSHADYLSRNPVVEVHHISRPRNWAQIAQAADNETQSLIKQLQEGHLDPSRYVHQNDTLYYRYSPVGEKSRLLCFIPKGHRLSLLRIFHDEHDHVGVDKTLHLILQHFWFPGLRQFVAKYIGHCLVCISIKRVPRAPHQFITSWPKPDTPFETIHADALGPLPISNGYKYVLILIDSFSKYCLLYPMQRQDAEELKQALSNAISLFGAPKLLVADRGRMFEANIFVKWLQVLGCDMHYVTPEMHHSNGQVERYIRTTLNMIRIEANHKNRSWSDTLWRLQLVLNITKQKTTQFSPMNLLIGIDGATPIIRNLVRDVAVEDAQPNHAARREMCRARASELLAKNRAQQDENANAKRRPARMFQVGDLVFAIKYSQSTGKLDPGMRGPYRVIKALPSSRYELKLLSGSYGKTTQAAAEYLVLWRGEWCPESCAAFFENDDSTDPGAGPSQAPDEASTQQDLLDLPAVPAIDSQEPRPIESYGTDEDTASNEEDLTGFPTYDAVGDDTLSGEAVLDQ